jgi:cytochrome c biogenesis protein CcmG/thiol:disulfide interchange protein DsbE
MISLVRACALTLAVLATAAAASAAPVVGKPAPPFTLPALDGKQVSLASLKGRPVYLNFFASWCGPCNEEAPAIAKLARKYAPQGVTTIGVDALDGTDHAKAFKAQYKLPYQVLVDNDNVTKFPYLVFIGLPVHVFIRKDGTVNYFRQGEMSAAQIEAQYKALR